TTPSYSAGTQRSFHFWFNVNAIDSTARRILDSNLDGVLLANTQTPNMSYNPHWSSTNGSFGFITPTTGTLHDVFISYDGSSTSSIPTIFVDGVSKTITTLTTPVGTLNSGGAVYNIGNSVALTRSWNG